MTRSGEADDVAPSTFHITYADTHGEMTERVVTIQRLERSGDQVRLHGLCHLRGAYRQFLPDRIEEIFDASTGEVHGDASRFLREHPLYSHPREPEQVALKVCQDHINLLTVVGAADGLFDPDEQDRLLIHVYDHCDHLTLDESEMRHLLAMISPDETSFHSSLKRLKKSNEAEITTLFRTLRKLVDADGVLHPSEVAFLVEIEDVLRGKAS